MDGKIGREQNNKKKTKNKNGETNNSNNTEDLRKHPIASHGKRLTQLILD